MPQDSQLGMDVWARQLDPERGFHLVWRAERRTACTHMSVTCKNRLLMAGLDWTPSSHSLRFRRLARTCGVDEGELAEGQPTLPQAARRCHAVLSCAALPFSRLCMSFQLMSGQRGREDFLSPLRRRVQCPCPSRPPLFTFSRTLEQEEQARCIHARRARVESRLHCDHKWHRIRAFIVHHPIPHSLLGWTTRTARACSPQRLRRRPGTHPPSPSRRCIEDSTLTKKVKGQRKREGTTALSMLRSCCSPHPTQRDAVVALARTPLTIASVATPAAAVAPAAGDSPLSQSRAVTQRPRQSSRLRRRSPTDGREETRATSTADHGLRKETRRGSRTRCASTGTTSCSMWRGAITPAEAQEIR